jgi:hypothetical protein
LAKTGSFAKTEPFPKATDDSSGLADRREAVSSVARPGGSQHGEAPTASPSVWNVPEYSAELPLPGMHRAALAITLGQPAALRRLALDLEQAGQEAEAGLLGNYALLLERSNASRERVMTEVARMLRAAVADRRSTHRPRRSASPALPTVPAQTVAPSTASTSTASTPTAAGPIAASPAIPCVAITAARDAAPAQRPRAVIPLPVFAVGARRRAAR